MVVLDWIVSAAFFAALAGGLIYFTHWAVELVRSAIRTARRMTAQSEAKHARQAALARARARAAAVAVEPDDGDDAPASRAYGMLRS